MLLKIQHLSALQNAQKQNLKYLTKVLPLVSIAILMHVKFISFYSLWVTHVLTVVFLGRETKLNSF